MARRFTWSSAAHSHVGKVRKLNEDACLSLPNFGDAGLWVVADGMGGHEAGEVASRMIVESLREVPPPLSLEDFMASAEAALLNVNQNLKEQSEKHYNRRTIGSTVVVFLIYQDRAACLWVGDSRIYRLRQHRLEQLTRDHSHVQELVDRGLINAQEAESHPMANVITRAVGSSFDLRVDQETFELEAGDTFLLCSDGLNKTVSDDEIAAFLKPTDSYSTVQDLIQTALNRGASDNVTTIVINIQDYSESDGDEDKTVPIDPAYLRERNRR